MSELLQGVDTIIFDFGNVMIDLDYPQVIRAFKEVANKNQDNIRKLVMDSKILQKFEMGMISPDRFRAGVNQILDCKLSESKFDAIWNSMLKNVSKPRLDAILKIGEKYNTYILSNTNLIHEIAFEEMVMAATGRPSIREFVKEAYFSHEIGLRKPDLSFYNHLIEDISNYPSRMLFLDDRLDNVESARKAGMKAVQVFDPDKQIKEIFGFG